MINTWSLARAFDASFEKLRALWDLTTPPPMGHDLDVPNEFEPSLDDDELVAVRGLIQERYHTDSPAPQVVFRYGVLDDPAATIETSAADGPAEVSDAASPISAASPSAGHPDAPADSSTPPCGSAGRSDPSSVAVSDPLAAAIKRAFEDSPDTTRVICYIATDREFKQHRQFDLSAWTLHKDGGMTTEWLSHDESRALLEWATIDPSSTNCCPSDSRVVDGEGPGDSGIPQPPPGRPTSELLTDSVSAILDLGTDPHWDYGDLISELRERAELFKNIEADK